MLYFVTSSRAVGVIKLNWVGDVEVLQEIRFNTAIESVVSLDDSYQVIVGNNSGDFFETWSTLEALAPSERITRVNCPCEIMSISGTDRNIVLAVGRRLGLTLTVITWN